MQFKRDCLALKIGMTIKESQKFHQSAGYLVVRCHRLPPRLLVYQIILKNYCATEKYLLAYLSTEHKTTNIYLKNKGYQFVTGLDKFLRSKKDKNGQKKFSWIAPDGRKKKEMFKQKVIELYIKKSEPSEAKCCKPHIYQNLYYFVRF